MIIRHGGVFFFSLVFILLMQPGLQIGLHNCYSQKENWEKTAMRWVMGQIGLSPNVKNLEEKNHGVSLGS